MPVIMPICRTRPETLHGVGRAVACIPEGQPGLTIVSAALVSRKNTVRPGAVNAGAAKIIAAHVDRIAADAERVLDDGSIDAAMTSAVNPYVGGHTAAGTLATIQQPSP